MRFLRRLANNEDADSFANAFRRARFDAFRALIADLPRPVRILDIGGTETYWMQMGLTDPDHVAVTLANIVPVPTSLPNFSAITADACRLEQYGDDSFDVVFSNSVIEHVPTVAGQRAMAAEIRRLAPRYYVQTPNRYFPLEPHYLFPFFQFLPILGKAALLRSLQLGWAKRASSWPDALEDARSIRLLTAGEMSELFSDGSLARETIAGLSKSIIMTRKTPNDRRTSTRQKPTT